MAEYMAIDLPGKPLYPKQFNVSVRKITPIEQKYIISLGKKEQRNSKDYLNFVKKLVAFDNPEMTFEELFAFDLRYILYRIRFATYAKYPVKLTYRCLNPDCKSDITEELNLDTLQIYEPSDLKDVKFEINLEKLGPVAIRNKIVKDDVEIEEFVKRHNIDEDNFDMRLLFLDLLAVSEGRSLEEMYKLAEEDQITAEDIANIEHWLEKAVWGVKEELKVKCPKCGKEETRAYELVLEDFFSAF